MQLLIRRMTNVAYLDPSVWKDPKTFELAKLDDGDPSVAMVSAYVEATVGWNNAIYAALLVAPPSVAAKIPPLDQEVDRLCDLAVARTWTRTEFRRERAELGRMAAEYLRTARNLAGLADIALPSVNLDLGPGQRRTTPGCDAGPRIRSSVRRFAARLVSVHISHLLIRNCVHTHSLPDHLSADLAGATHWYAVGGNVERPRGAKKRPAWPSDQARSIGGLMSRHT